MTKKKKFSIKKLLKKISLISGIVIVAFLIILALIPVLFKSKILQIVKNEANKSLNATVEFSDVSLSLFRGFPSINLKLNDLYVVGIDEFEKDTLLKFDELSANLNLKSVIFGDKIKVNSIVLDKADIYVKVLYDGKANYDIVKVDSTDTDEPDNEDKDEDEETKKDDKAFIIALKKFQINNANIIYDDQEADVYSKIENLNFNLKGDLSEDFTSIELLLTIDSLSVSSEGIQYVDRASFLFDSELDADMVKQKYTFKDNLLKINEIELGFDGFVEMPDSNIVMDISFATKVTEFKSLLSMLPAVYQKDFDDIQTSGTFKFEGFAKGTYNSESIPAFEVDFAVNNAWFQYPDLPQAVTDINIAVHVENPGDIDINTIDISKFQFKMAKNPVNAQIYVKTSAADIYAKGDINAKINLSTVEQFYPLEDDMTLSGLLDMDLGFKGNLSDIENENYENFHSEGRFLITDMVTKQEDLPPITISKTELVFSPDIAELKTFDAQIGKSDIHLDGKIFNLFQYVFSDAVLTANFNLTSKLFDANDFMSYEESEPETENKSETGTNSETTATEESEITAFEVPANIDFTLNSTINKVFYEKLIITNLLGQIKIADSKLSLTNLSMNLLKGSMRLTALYDAKDIQNPYAEFSFSMNKIDIVETYNAFTTVQKLAPIAENCTGRISTSFNVNTNLDYNLNPVYNTLNGDGNFSSNNISVTGNKVFSILANLTKNEAYRNPSVSDLFLEFEITDGNVEIKPTSFTLAQTEATIAGTTNLDKTIDYQLGLIVPKNMATNLISNLPFIKLKENVEIYANIGGTIDEPKIIDFGSNFTDNIKDDIKEGLSEAAKKYLKKVRQEADKLVADAKAQRDKLVADAKKEVARIKKQAQDESDKLLDDAKKRGDAEINKAKNPVAKRLAKELAARLMVEAKKEANKKIEQGNQKTLGLVNKATQKGDKLVEDAEKEAAQKVKDAEKKAETM